jgi:hypothetical protein
VIAASRALTGDFDWHEIGHSSCEFGRSHCKKRQT